VTLVGLEHRLLAKTLREADLITEEQLERGLNEAPAHPGERLGERLVRLGFIDDDTLVRALALQHGLTFTHLLPGLGDPEVAKILDREWARGHGVLPLYRVHSQLTVAIADPTDVFTQDHLRRMTGLELRLVVAPLEEIQRGVAQADRGNDALRVDTLLPEDEGAAEEELQVVEAIDDDDGANEADQSPIVKVVNFLISKAIIDGASDIHVEPDEDVLRVRYRIDGILREVMHPPVRHAPALVSRVKIMSGLDIAERRAPQDGRMQVIVRGRSVDLRVSTLPTYHGEKTVIRILDRNAMVGDLGKLGLSERILEGLSDQVHRPNGVTLVTGPTGSGKTTTLYACLATINSIDRNICTVENPTEYNLKLVNQVQVNERAGLTFESALRSLLRQDPDVMMIGEIRDRITAQIAIEAALTGHLVFSTLHTNDAISAVPRLVNMGIESYLLAAALNGVLAQRLVRRICPSCRTEVPIPDRIRALFERYEIPLERLHRGEGCQHCSESGFRGRAGIYELFVIDDELRDLITTDASLAPLKAAARRQGHVGLAYDGLSKVAEGVTSVEEVLRVCEIQQ